MEGRKRDMKVQWMDFNGSGNRSRISILRCFSCVCKFVVYLGPEIEIFLCSSSFGG